MKAYIYECITVEMCEAIHEFMCAYECECMNEGKYKRINILYIIYKSINVWIYECVWMQECINVCAYMNAWMCGCRDVWI